MYFIKKDINSISKIDNSKKWDILIDNREQISKLFSFKNETFIVACNDLDLSNDIYYLLGFLNYFREYRTILIKNMDQYNNSIETEDNKYVRELVDYFKDLNSDGKFIRGFLILLGYKFISNSDISKAIPLALAFELFQTSVLIHDDIIDRASIRRGKDTIPTRYINKYRDASHLGDSLAICMGDLGFYKSYELMINNYCDNKRLLKYYNDVIINTIQGEIIDVILPHLQMTGSYKEKKLENSVYDIYRLKTAWYSIIGPLCMGMILGDASDKEVSMMTEFAYNLGIAFQIKDDILGIFSEKVKKEKNSSDISEFKQTILYSYIYENSPVHLEQLHKYYGKSNLSDEDLEASKKIFIDSGALDYANRMVNHLFKVANERLGKLDFIADHDKDILRGFIVYLENRDH